MVALLNDTLLYPLSIVDDSLFGADFGFADDLFKSGDESNAIPSENALDIVSSQYVDQKHPAELEQQQLQLDQPADQNQHDESDLADSLLIAFLSNSSSSASSPSPSSLMEDQDQYIASPVFSAAVPSPESPPASKKPRKVSPKKEKKRMQNQRAATKYRERKRSETVALKRKLEELERINGELKSKEEKLEGEIHLVKELLNTMGIPH